MNREGFTLMEMVIAIAMASVVALFVHRGLHELEEMTARAAERREAAAHAAAVRRQLVGWLRGAHLGTEPAAGAFEGRDGADARVGSSDDRLAFPTLAPDPFRAGEARVQLGISRGPGTSATGLVARLSYGRDNAGPLLPLVPQATGFDVRYLFDPGDGPRWTNDWVSSARLPAAVELRLSGDSLPPLLRFPILVTLAGGT